MNISISAVGPGNLSYQWKKDGKTITDGKDYVRTNSQDLTINNLVMELTGDYTCAVSDSGGSTIISVPARVTLGRYTMF